MNIYLKRFLQRGLVFGGFGPIIAGIVYYIISLSVPTFILMLLMLMLLIPLSQEIIWIFIHLIVLPF